MLKSEILTDEDEIIDGAKQFMNLEKLIDYSAAKLLCKSVFTFLTTFFSLLYKFCYKSIEISLSKPESNMHRRPRGCEEVGPIYLLRSFRDQVQLFQEKRGYTPEENNFVNLISIIVQQAGNAMYAVLTMFLALLPGFTILLHVGHFVLDRLLDIVTTRRQSDILFKGAIFLLQLITIFLALRFVTMTIFSPILHMQLTILSKLTFMEDNVGTCF